MVPDEEGNECKRRMYAPSEEQVADTLKIVAVRGAEWVISPIGCKTLRPRDIRENLTIWYFIKHQIMLTTHDTTIAVEGIMLLYNIRIVLPINLEVTIRRELVECGLHRSVIAHQKSYLSQLKSCFFPIT